MASDIRCCIQKHASCLGLRICGGVLLVGGVLPRNAAAAAAQKVVEDALQPGYAAAAMMAKPKPKARVRGAVHATTAAERAAAAAAAATVGLWEKPATAPSTASADAPQDLHGKKLALAACVCTASHYPLMYSHTCLTQHMCFTCGSVTCQLHLPLIMEVSGNACMLLKVRLL